MLATVRSATLHGLEPQIIEVEAGLLKGLSSFTIVGLPDKAVDESRERITLALRSINAKPPSKLNSRTVINLAPGDVRKEGSHLDLAIALSFLAASEQARAVSDDTLCFGELGLDGSLRCAHGVLPLVLGGLAAGFSRFLIPADNAAEMRYVRGGKIYSFRTLSEVVGFLEGTTPRAALEPEAFAPQPRETDLAFLKLPPHLWRTLTLVAAGRHNLLLYGPPGTGKTLIGRALATLLPPLTYDQALDVTGVYSASGELREGFITHPPFRHPHHTASPVAILGGGQNVRPGEVSLAHHGVLFLDELPEFQRNVLEGLREPLEEREITIARAKKRVRFAANFLFVGATNPCPCGFADDPQRDCSCSVADIRRYQKKLSGPILDRMDIFLAVPRLEGSKTFDPSTVDIPQIQREIAQLHQRQLERQGKCNGELTPQELEQRCPLMPEAQRMLEQAIDRLALSLRAVHKIIRVAQTIADLENSKIIEEPHVAEAVQYRFWRSE